MITEAMYSVITPKLVFVWLAFTSSFIIGYFIFYTSAETEWSDVEEAEKIFWEKVERVWYFLFGTRLKRILGGAFLVIMPFASRDSYLLLPALTLWIFPGLGLGLIFCGLAFPTFKKA